MKFFFSGGCGCEIGASGVAKRGRRGLFATPTAAKRHAGQTLVETALILVVVLLPLTLGIIQFGLIFNATNTMTQIAREAGRYAAVHCKEATFDGPDTAPAAGAQGSLKFYLKTVADQTGIKWDSIKDSVVVTPATPATRTKGDAVTVSVTYPMKNKVFLGSLSTIAPVLSKLDDPYTSKSTFVVE